MKKKLTAMIVDDSPFSRTLLSETLKEKGFEVVGEADCLDEVIKTYKETTPDFVTMDIAMPDADGFECSRALLLADPKAKIILISSMKDDETEADARRLGISGYVQKPVDENVLVDVINHIFAPDTSFEDLRSGGIEIFKEALSQNITSMTKSVVKFGNEECNTKEHISQGITTVIGIIGRYTGTMILDLSMESAEKITKTLLKRDPKNTDELLAMSAELANVIAGFSCSMLNKKDRAYGFRVSPPSIFHGKSTQITSPNIEVKGCYVETDFGQIFLAVGFKRGNVLWM